MSLIPKKGTVYVVDDDEAVRDSLQWLLEGKDYRVKCFESAEAFLARFDVREVACLICDIRMEGMTGLELQAEIDRLGCDCAMIVMTAFPTPASQAQALGAGARAFLTKPIDPDLLLDAIEGAA